MSRILGLLLLLVGLAAGAVWAASPILAFQQLRRAAEAGDREQLEALVDFPAVREGLKSQVDSRAIKLARKAQGLGLPGTLIGKLGAAIGDRAVDRVVTPDGLAELVRSGEVPGRRHRDPDPGADAGAAPGRKAVVSYGYLSPDRFKASVAPAREPSFAVGFIMDRQGLFSWRVVRIELPGR